MNVNVNVLLRFEQAGAVTLFASRPGPSQAWSAGAATEAQPEQGA